jgi:hypothetical protein
MTYNLANEINQFTQNMKESNLGSNSNWSNTHQQTQNQRINSQNATNQNHADLEFRDEINDRVNDIYFSQPEQGRGAIHYYDPSLVRDNPQYHNSHNSDENIYRRDHREGMNVRMDSLMFQSFNQPNIPQNIRVNNPIENSMSRTQKMQPAFDHTLFGQSSQQMTRENRPSYSEASLKPEMIPVYPQHQQIQNINRNQNQYINQNQNQHMNQNQNQNQSQNQNSSFLVSLPTTFNNVFHQTNRVSNRDRQNERMQSFSSLPKTTNQPNDFMGDRAHASPYKFNNETNYYQSGDPEQEVYLGNVGRSTGGYMQGTFQNSRVNNKDTNNERLQNLTPLACTSATPVSTFDYVGSVNQINQVRYDSRQHRNQDLIDRQSLADQRKNEWERMSSNINQLTGKQKLVVNDIRPVDTRQID